MSRSLNTLLGVALLAGFAISCNRADAPEVVASEFIESLHSRKFDQASSLSTASTRPVINKMQTQSLPASNTINTSETLFHTATLKAKTNATEATVENDVVSLNLVKEDDEWKVVASQDVVESILNRNQFVEDAKIAWESLKGEFQKRNALAAEYLSSVGNNNADLLKVLDAAKNADDVQKQTYIAKQEAMEVILNQKMQPSFTAGSDLSINYIVQLSAMTDRIREMRQAYNAAAKKAHTRDYAPVQ